MKAFPVTAPDGAQLHGLVATTVPARGTVVIRTPYNCASHIAQAQSWKQRGYNCLVQDVRGRYRSEGHWRPYTTEGSDGADTIRAVISSSWHQGGIVLSGSSYEAHSALETAKALELFPDIAGSIAGIVACVPALGRYETAREPAGIPRLADRLGWWHQHGFGARSGPPLSRDELARLLIRAKTRGLVNTHPLYEPDLDQRRQWSSLWAAQPLDLRRRYRRVSAPLLVISGSTDFFIHEALALWRSWSAPTRLISGPWGHSMMSGLNPEDPAYPHIRQRGNIGTLIHQWLEHTARNTTSDDRQLLSTFPDGGKDWIDTTGLPATPVDLLGPGTNICELYWEQPANTHFQDHSACLYEQSPSGHRRYLRTGYARRATEPSQDSPEILHFSFGLFARHLPPGHWLSVETSPLPVLA